MRVLGASGGNVHGVDLIISGASANTEGSARDGGDIILHAGMKAGSGTHGNVIINPNQGNVGIGTTSPDSLLTITGSSKKMLSISSSFAGPSGISVARNSGDRIDLHANYSGFGGGLNSTDALRFSTNDSGISSPSMYIETDGKVGIGITTPTKALQVTGDISASGDLVVQNGSLTTVGATNLRLNMTDDHFDSGSFTIFSPNTTENTRIIMGVTSASNASSGRGSFINTTYSTGGTFALRFLQAGTEKMRIDHGGKVGIGTTSPTKELQL